MVNKYKQSADSDRKIFKHPNGLLAHSETTVYSPALEASFPPAQVLYVSGQIGLDPSTMEMPEGVEEQARQALTNIGQLLRVSRVREQGAGQEEHGAQSKG